MPCAIIPLGSGLPALILLLGGFVTELTSFRESTMAETQTKKSPRSDGSAHAAATAEQHLSREQLIHLLNQDLAREYQAIIAYVVYSQVLKGPQYMTIAGELELHAKQELQHAMTIAKQIDYLGGMPTVTPQPAKTSEKAEEM